MIIVYKSNTGYTRQYAEMLSEATGLSAFPLGKIPGYHRGEDAIYMGWLMAGSVSGLNRAKKICNVICVVATGMTAESVEQESFVHGKSKLAPSVPLFYLQSGYDAKKLKGIYKFMMKIKTPEILGRYEGKTESEKKEDATYRMVTDGYSVVSRERLQRVVDWIKQK